MPRLNNLNDVLFPVQEHPVFVKIQEPFGERQVPVPDKKAIVHGKTRHVLGIVSRDYRLVSNREALDWASECCRMVFPETKPGEWRVGGALANLRRHGRSDKAQSMISRRVVHGGPVVVILWSPLNS